MAIRRKTITYYSCDGCRFQEEGTEKCCPAGWRYLFTLIPGKEEQQPEIKALICPKCDEWIKQQLDAICVQERQEEEEEQTDSSEGNPFPRSPGLEQRKPSAIEPIRQLFRQGEEEKTDSSEGTAFPLRSRPAQQKVSPIEPIGRSLEQGEEEKTDSSEELDSRFRPGPSSGSRPRLSLLGDPLSRGKKRRLMAVRGLHSRFRPSPKDETRQVATCRLRHTVASSIQHFPQKALQLGS